MTPFICDLFFNSQSIGEFVLSDANMIIPKRGNIFAINEGYAKFWDKDVTEYVRQCKFPEVTT